MKTEYANSKAIFVGEVLIVTTDVDIKTFTFKVEKRWKGAANKEIKVSVQETTRHQAWFEVGENILFSHTVIKLTENFGKRDVLELNRSAMHLKMYQTLEKYKSLSKIIKLIGGLNATF